MKRYFKERALLSGLQAVLDTLVVYSLWGLQLMAAAGLLSFAWMGMQLGVSSYKCFAPPEGRMEATSHKQHITGKNEDHATTESSEPKDSDNNGAGDNDAGDPGRPQHNHASTSRADEALHVAFLGLEFVLFAPLFFLLLRSLTQYIVDLSMNDCAVSLRGNVGGLINGDSVIQKRKEIGKQSLFDAKALSVGLLFAIVATHLVGGLLSSKYEEGRTADRLEIVVGLCLLVFLGLTYLSMELISHRDRGDKRQ